MSETDPISDVAITANGAGPPDGAGIIAVGQKDDHKENSTTVLENENKDAAEGGKDDDVEMEEAKHKEEGKVAKLNEGEKMEELNKAKGDEKTEIQQNLEAGLEVDDVKGEEKENETLKEEEEKVEDVGRENGSEEQEGHAEEVEDLKEFKYEKVCESKESGEVDVGEVREVKDVNGEDKDSEEQKVADDDKEEVMDVQVEERKKPEEQGDEGEEPTEMEEAEEDKEIEEQEVEEEEVKEMEEEVEKKTAVVGENGRKRKRSRGGIRKKGEEEENKGRKMTKEVLGTPMPSSLDRPQRERKTVERLVEVIEKGNAVKALRVEKGRGIPLKDIPNVAYKLSKRKVDDIKVLHLLLFGRRGKYYFQAVDFKNHISQFSGFVWNGDEDKQKAKVKEKLDKYHKEKLLDFCDIFDIPVSKTAARKEDLVVKLLDFMVAPHVTTDALLADKEQHSSGSRKRKRVARGSSSKSGGSSGKHTRKRQAKGEDIPKSTEKHTSGSESEDEDSEEVSENDHHVDNEEVNPSHSEKENDSEKDEKHEDEKDEDSEKSLEETKKPSKSKGSSGKMKSKNVPTPVKSTTPTSAKSPVKASSIKHTKSDDNNDTSEKTFSRKKKVEEKKITPKLEHAATTHGRRGRKGKTKTAKTEDSGPSKEELRKMICEILKEVDFNTATFTDILKQLAKHFKTDLTPRKASIKLMIQDELTKLAEAEDDNEEDEDDEGDAEKDEQRQPSGKEVEA